LLAVLSQSGVNARLRCDLDHLAPGSSNHFGGAVRMHASAEYGMLDSWNRMHAVPNVVVVDASSFTTAVEKNPTLTAMALATRAADRLADDILSVAEIARAENDAAIALR
jgi:choline dehydrogenase-like flavoprotein